MGKRRPVLASECDQLARQRRSERADLGVEAVWHDVAGDDGHPESGGGQGSGGGDLAGLHGPAWDEPRARTLSEDEL